MEYILVFFGWFLWDCIREKHKEMTSMDEEYIVKRQNKKKDQERVIFLSKKEEKKRFDIHKRTIEEFEKRTITSKL